MFKWIPAFAGITFYGGSSYPSSLAAFYGSVGVSSPSGEGGWGLKK